MQRPVITTFRRSGGFLLLSLAACAGPLPAQPVYDLLLKGGHVIDPANEIDRVSDITRRFVRRPVMPPFSRRLLNLASVYFFERLDW